MLTPSSEKTSAKLPTQLLAAGSPHLDPSTGVALEFVGPRWAGLAIAFRSRALVLRCVCGLRLQ